MIYVITPLMSDYMNVCQANNFETKRRSRDNFATWISSPLQFMGKRFTKEDKILYGEKYHDFQVSVLNRFELEIAIRSSKSNGGRTSDG